MARGGAIGLDIGTRTVHVAHVGTVKGRSTVVNFGGVELAPDVAREGEILDVAAAADAVKQLIASAGIREKKVQVGVANQRVVVRQIDLPDLPDHELRESMRYQIQEYIPIPVEEAELDFHVVDRFTGEGGEPLVRLLLVAASRDMVANHVEAAVKAGLKPVGVDLNPFAVLRSMGETSNLQATGGEVLIDVGAGVTNIVAHELGVPKFVRILVMGGHDITEALMAGLSTSSEEAERIKRSTGLSPSATDVGPRIINDRAGAFVDEIRSSLDYYATQAGGPRLSGAVLTGGGALLPGLAERLSGVLRLPVRLGDPFERWPVKDTVYGPEQLAQVGPTLATAIGLALEGAS